MDIPLNMNKKKTNSTAFAHWNSYFCPGPREIIRQVKISLEIRHKLKNIDDKLNFGRLFPFLHSLIIIKLI